MDIRQAIDALSGATVADLAAELDRAEANRDVLAAMLMVRRRAEESDGRVRRAKAVVGNENARRGG